MHFIDACALPTITPAQSRTARVACPSPALFDVEMKFQVFDARIAGDRKQVAIGV